MWKPEHPVQFGDDALDVVYPTKGTWDFRTGQLTIAPTYGLETSEGICLGELDHNSQAAPVTEFPVLPIPLRFERDSTDPELVALFDEFEQCLDKFMEKGLRMIQATPALVGTTFKVLRKTHRLVFTHHPRTAGGKHRAHIAVIAKEAAHAPR